jgi:protein involved in polysaccharide export with SLBB domain
LQILKPMDRTIAEREPAALVEYVRYILVGCLALGCALLLPVPAEAQSNATSAAASLQVGDAIRVVVWRNPEMSGQFDIGEDGTVLHPLYRGIRIVGMPLGQAEAEFRRLLQRFETNPEFVIEPLFRISIDGAVRSPNIYTFPPHTTVAQAVSLAGGGAPGAALSRARLLRDGVEHVIDLTRPHSEFASFRIRSGDQIILDPSRHVWRDVVSPVLTAAGSVASIAFLVIRINERR